MATSTCPVAREFNWLANTARAVDLADDAVYWDEQRKEHKRGCIACANDDINAQGE